MSENFNANALSLASFSRSGLMKEKAKEFVTKTSTHGISNIIHASGRSLKLVWTIFFTISGSFFCFLVAKEVNLYLTYPVTTSIQLITQKEVEMPTVAFCTTFVTEYSVDLILSILTNKTDHKYE